VRLLRGLLAELDENLAAHAPAEQDDPRGRLREESPFVREVWAQSKAELAGLSDEAIKALQAAYAEGVVFNGFLARSIGGMGGMGQTLAEQRVEAIEAFRRARVELGRWFPERPHGRAETEVGARGRGEVVGEADRPGP
jgi:hypothetical protein